MFYGRNNSSNNWQIKTRTHLQNQLFSKTDTCEPSSEFSSSFTVSVSLAIRVAIQISRVFRFQPTLSDASSIPPRGRRPRKHSIPLKLCLRSKKLSRWTENPGSNNKPGWVKATRCPFQYRLWIPSVSEKKEEWAPFWLPFRFMSLISCFHVPCCSLIYAFLWIWIFGSVSTYTPGDAT